MKLSTGIDIIDTRRIENTLIRFGDKFTYRCFSKEEIEYSEKKYQKINSYAKRYAAKEACAKALGTGLARGVFWKDICVINNKWGKPYIKLFGKAEERLKKMDPKANIEVSLSDEKNYAIANVIIYLNI